MTRRDHSHRRGYLVAIGSIAVACWVRYLADDYVGSGHIFSTFFAAVAITAWRAGFGPGLLAAVLGYLMGDLLFIPPRGTLSVLKFHLPVLAGFATYSFVCGVIVLTNEALRRAQLREHALFEQTKRQAVERQRLIEAEQTARADADEARRMLREREEYGLMGEAIPYGVWKADPNGKLLYVSPSLLSLLEMTLDEVQHFGWLRRLPSEDARPLRARWLHCMRTGEPWEAELRLIGSDGKKYYIVSRGRPLRGAAGAIISWVGINLDIGEQKRSSAERERLQTELHRQLAELAEVDRRKDRFLSMLGHELRNPIAAICSAVDVLQMHELLPAESADMLGVLSRQSIHLTRLVDDLLDVSRINEGKISLQRETVDLGEVVRATTRDYQACCRQSGCRLRLDLPDTPIWMEGDRVRLAQIVGNLLHNAFKFAAGSEVSVSLSHELSSRQACLVVRDCGVGIAPEILARVFEPFCQGEPKALRAGGLGLGLAVVKGLVELHGGHITATSSGRGGGAEFQITFPCLIDFQPGGPAKLPVKHVPSLRILLVEDQPDVARATEQLLATHGHQVFVAHDAAEGIAGASAFEPDVILCDISLSGELSGYDVARAVRQNPLHAGAHLIALTGYGREEDRRMALAAGFESYLIKPLDIGLVDQLLAASIQQPGHSIAGFESDFESARSLYRAPR